MPRMTPGGGPRQARRAGEGSGSPRARRGRLRGGAAPLCPGLPPRPSEPPVPPPPEAAGGGAEPRGLVKSVCVWGLCSVRPTRLPPRQRSSSCRGALHPWAAETRRPLKWRRVPGRDFCRVRWPGRRWRRYCSDRGAARPSCARVRWLVRGGRRAAAVAALTPAPGRAPRGCSCTSNAPYLMLRSPAPPRGRSRAAERRAAGAAADAAGARRAALQRRRRRLVWQR